MNWKNSQVSLFRNNNRLKHKLEVELLSLSTQNCGKILSTKQNEYLSPQKRWNLEREKKLWWMKQIVKCDNVCTMLNIWIELKGIPNYTCSKANAYFRTQPNISSLWISYKFWKIEALIHSQLSQFSEELSRFQTKVLRSTRDTSKMLSSGIVAFLLITVYLVKFFFSIMDESSHFEWIIRICLIW